MLKQFDANSYPFRFYSNATGDLFIPPQNDSEDFTDLQDMSELPYPLQHIYEQFWSEQYGWLTYLVEHDGTFGLMLEQEFSADSHDADYSEKMTALYQDVLNMGRAIEKSLDIFCKPAEVLVGNSSGFDDCHELCIFVPASASKHEIEDMIYLLQLASDKKPLPVEKADMYTAQYTAFMERMDYFSSLHGICEWYADKPVVPVEFSMGEEESFTVLVAKPLLCEDGVYAPEKVHERLQQIVQNIKKSAKAFGKKPEFDELVVRACNAVFPGGWSFPNPVFSVYIGGDDISDSEDVCPRCGAPLMHDEELENGVSKKQLWCADCGFTSVSVKESTGFKEIAHCNGFGASTIHSKSSGTMQECFSEQISKEAALAKHHQRLAEIPDVTSSSLTWWNPDSNKLETLLR